MCSKNIGSDIGRCWKKPIGYRIGTKKPHRLTFFIFIWSFLFLTTCQRYTKLKTFSRGCLGTLFPLKILNVANLRGILGNFCVEFPVKMVKYTKYTCIYIYLITCFTITLYADCKTLQSHCMPIAHVSYIES